MMNVNSSVVAELGSQTTAYYRANGKILYAKTGTTICNYTYNGHGDVVKASAQTYTYDAFGNQRNPSDNDTNPFRYCGEYWDGESGQIYLRARYYDPGIGRFVSEDTHWNTGNMIYGDDPDGKNPIPNISAIMQSGNLYWYCHNDPVNFFDFTGEEENEDKFFLSPQDYALTKAYTKLYDFFNMVGDLNSRDAMRRAVVSIRQKEEYRYKFSRGNADGIYVDNYQYAFSGDEFVSFVSGTVMSEGYAWLLGGDNEKNDRIMDVATLIDQSPTSDFLTGAADVLKELSGDNIRNLRAGDIEIQIIRGKTIGRYYETRYDRIYFDKDANFLFWSFNTTR